jgi:uncharacterized RDD family membrane protein YckC
MDTSYCLRRIPAYLVDFIIIILLITGYTYLTGRHNADGSMTLDHTYPKLEILLIAHSYYIIQEYYWHKTIGKKLVGLYVRRADGAKVTLKDVFIRNSTNTIEVFLFPFIALATVLFSRKRQRLGDMLAKTVVVDKSL